jgi:hypothetical protein
MPCFSYYLLYFFYKIREQEGRAGSAWRWRREGEKVDQIMYTHINKYKNAKVNCFLNFKTRSDSIVLKTSSELEKKRMREICAVNFLPVFLPFYSSFSTISKKYCVTLNKFLNLGFNFLVVKS